MPEVEVGIYANAAGVEPGVDAAKAEFGSLEASLAQLTASMVENTATMRASMSSMTATMTHEAKEEENVLLKLKESIVATREAMSGAAEAFIAFFMVEEAIEFAKHLGEVGEQVQHVSERLGIATTDVQALGAVATLSGGGLDQVASAMGRLDKALAAAKEGAKTQKQAFAELGIDITKTYTQMELLGATMDAFASHADGPAKAAASLALLGRSGLLLIPFLNEGKAGFEELTRMMAAYDIQDAEAVAKGAELGRTFNENKVAMAGLGNVLTDALAPAFTETVKGVNELIAGFIKSYQEGGDAKTVMDALVFTLKVLITTAALAGEVLVVAFKGGKSAIEETQHSAEAFGNRVNLVFRVLGETTARYSQMMRDAQHGDLQAVMQDWDDMQRSAVEGQQNMMLASAMDAQQTYFNWHTAVLSIQSDFNGLSAFANNLFRKPAATDGWFDMFAAQHPKKQGTTADMPSGGGKGAHGESEMGKWEQELHQQEMDAAAKTGAYLADQTAAELAFWQGKAAIAGEGSKTWYEVQAKIYEATRASQQRAASEEAASFKEQLQLHKDSWTLQLADYDAHLADIAQRSGTDSAAYKNALREKEAAERAHAEAMRAIQEKEIETAAKAAQETVATTLAIQKLGYAQQLTALKANADAGMVSRTAEYVGEQRILAMEQAAERAAAAQVYQIQLDKLTRVQAGLAAESKEWHQAEDEKLALTRQYGNQIQMLIVQQAAARMAQLQAEVNRIRQVWHTAIDPVVSAWGSAMSQMIQGTMSLRQAVASIGVSILNSFVSMIERMVENWIVNLLLGKVAQATMGAAQVASNAAIAASATYASISAIPIVGPGLAPGAAFAAYTAVMAFAPAAAAEQGYDVPSGVSPITKLHPKEMVLPADLAEPLRKTLRGQSPDRESQAGAMARGGGEEHHHAWTVHAFDSESLERYLRGPAGAVFAKAMMGRARNLGMVGAH